MSADRLGLAYPSAFAPGSPWAEPRQSPAYGPLLGDIELVTPPSGLAVSVDRVKLQVRQDDTADDAVLIPGQIRYATEAAELEITGHRQLLTATYDVPVRDWWNHALRLPRPPLQSVTWVKYYDASGTLQTLSSSYYSVRKPLRGVGVVEWAPNVSPPAVQCDRRFPITVRFVCGYGTADDLPAVAQQAILLMVDHAYRFRGGDLDAPAKLEIPPAAISLLEKLEWGSYA